VARQEGVPEIDEERLKDILGPIFGCQEQVVQAKLAVLQAKRQLQQDATTLSGNELALRGKRISELEQAQQDRQSQVRQKIEELLAAELRGWEERRRLAEDEQRRRQEEETRRRENEKAERRRREEAARQRGQAEAERRRQRRARRIRLVGLLLKWAAVASGILLAAGVLGAAFWAAWRDWREGEAG
jgi:hypothetical protein